MVHSSLAILAAAAGSVLAATPPGFSPASQNDLLVSFDGRIATSGSVQLRDATQVQPRIATTSRLTGTSYAVLMIDIDIPTANPPQTNTLLHWLQTGLTPATTGTRFNGTGAPGEVFLLNNSTGTAPLQAYFGPNPPARIPLSHRYTQILVDTSNAGPEAITVMQTAVRENMFGFNAEQVLAAAGLTGRVVAGNFFNVTNPGPVNNTATGGGGGGAGSGSGNGTTGGGNGTTGGGPLPGAGMMTTPQGTMVAGLFGVAALFALL